MCDRLPVILSKVPKSCSISNQTYTLYSLCILSFRFIHISLRHSSRFYSFSREDSCGIKPSSLEFTATNFLNQEMELYLAIISRKIKGESSIGWQFNCFRFLFFSKLVKNQMPVFTKGLEESHIPA